MEVSFGELVLIALIALTVLGPKELVFRAHQLGRWIAKIRTEINNFKILAEEQILREQEQQINRELLAKKNTVVTEVAHVDGESGHPREPS